MTPTPTPSFSVPNFMQGKPWQPAQQFAGQVPGLFDTTQMMQRGQDAITSQLAQARAAAASASAQYVNRAQQSGASGLGAGFAQGQAMLGAYNSANQAYSDLAGRQLQAKMAQGNLQGELYGRIGQLMGARQGQIGDLYTGFQNRAQNQSQFNSDLDYRNRSLAQNQSQFDASLSERKNEFGVTSGQSGMQNRLAALALAMKAPRQSFSWHTNASGNPMGDADATAMQGYGRQQDFYGNLQNQLQSFF